MIGPFRYIVIYTLKKRVNFNIFLKKYIFIILNIMVTGQFFQKRDELIKKENFK